MRPTHPGGGSGQLVPYGTMGIMLRYSLVPIQEVFCEEAGECRIRSTVRPRADPARRYGYLRGAWLYGSEHIEDCDACSGVEAGAICAIRQQASDARSVHCRPRWAYAVAHPAAVAAQP